MTQILFDGEQTEEKKLKHDLEMTERRLMSQAGNQSNIDVTASEEILTKGCLTYRKLESLIPIFDEDPEIEIAVFFCPNVKSTDIQTIEFMCQIKKALAKKGKTFYLVAPSSYLLSQLAYYRTEPFAISCEMRQVALQHPDKPENIQN